MLRFHLIIINLLCLMSIFPLLLELVDVLYHREYHEFCFAKRILVLIIFSYRARILLASREKYH